MADSLRRHLWRPDDELFDHTGFINANDAFDDREYLAEQFEPDAEWGGGCSLPCDDMHRDLIDPGHSDAWVPHQRERKDRMVIEAQREFDRYQAQYSAAAARFSGAIPPLIKAIVLKGHPSAIAVTVDVEPNEDGGMSLGPVRCEEGPTLVGGDNEFYDVDDAVWDALVDPVAWLAELEPEISQYEFTLR